MRVTIVADPLTPADDITLLPVGTFPIGGMCTRNTSLWGGWENNAKVYTGIWGSWYIDYNDIMRYPDRDEPKMAALIGGTVEIEYNPDTKIYNIVVDAFSDAGQPIKVDFEGPIRPDVSFIKFD